MNRKRLCPYILCINRNKLTRISNSAEIEIKLFPRIVASLN